MMQDLMQDPDPTTPLGRIALRARRVPVYIRVPAVFVAFLATVACAVADVPPYSLFADAQAAVLHGEHYPVLSIGLTAIVFLLPIGVALQLLAGSFPDNRPPGLAAEEPLPAHYGPPPAYMQGGPYAQSLYGQPPPGQAPYGQAPYGQAPYGQAPTGQPFYGQAPYGQAPYGQAPYGQAQQGQAPYGQAQQGQAPYGQAPTGQGPHGQPPQGNMPYAQAPAAQNSRDQGPNGSTA